MADGTIGGSPWVAGPVYPQKPQSQQDPAYDEMYNIKINPNNAKFSLWGSGAGTFIVDVPEGQFRYWKGDHSFCFYPPSVSGGEDIRDMTQQELLPFLGIVRKNTSGNPELKSSLDNIEKDAKNFSTGKMQRVGGIYDTGVLFIKFEIPNKNIMFEFAKYRENKQLSIMRYKTTVPEFFPEERAISAYEEEKENRKVSKRARTPNENECKFSYWIEVSDDKDLQFCKNEIKKYLPTLIQNLDPNDEKIKQLLVELDKEL